MIPINPPVTPPRPGRQTPEGVLMRWRIGAGFVLVAAVEFTIAMGLWPIASLYVAMLLCLAWVTLDAS
jgi:hypothetical protein